MRKPSAHRQLRALLRVATLIIAALCLYPASALAQTKIAVIDLRRAVLETEDGLRVQSKLKQLVDSHQSELESQEQAYKDATEEFLQLQKAKASKQKLQQKYEALKKLEVSVQSSLYASRRELQRQESEMMYPIIQRMLQLIRDLASKSGYDMVLNKEAVPYYRSDLDVTDRIIQMYNTSSSPAPTKEKSKKDVKRSDKPAPKK